LKKSAAEILACLRDHVALLDEAGAGFCLAGPGRSPAPAAGRTASPTPKPPAPPPARTAPKAPTHPASTLAHLDKVASADARDLGEIERQVLGCRLCPLHKLRTRAVPGEGHGSAELLFIGEAPGRDEDLQGRPFVGRAGQLLRKIIAAMKFKEDEVYITNVVKCRPPENRVPHRDEVETCWPYLVRQIELIKPRVIVTLGKTPTEHFVPGRAGMTELRGKFGDYRGIPVMPTFHPSYLVRNEGNREIRRMVWEDMQKVMALLGRK
jgi:uracil-DNA glycosylase family 4